jgi:spore germination cell wall hydrolase CwlJ-like protein
MIRIIISAIALTVMAPGHAEILTRDIECLAKNIFYEAANEPEEGMVAVGIVTMNRAEEGTYGGSTICKVVHHRQLQAQRHLETVTEDVRSGFFGLKQQQTTTQLRIRQVPVCQFSWTCEAVRKPRVNDQRWQQAQAVALALVLGGYETWREKYGTAMYFHSVRIRPAWAKSLKYITRIGGHVFYAKRI